MFYSSLVASRKSVEDADEAAVLAMTYHLTNNIDYLNKTRDILTSWAKINQPTGNPIDETRLEGMIWAYDLMACHLSKQDKNLILSWFERLLIKKKNWRLGLITTSNNYRIHQIKMLLLLDKILHRNNGWAYHLEQAKHYSTINLNPQSGASIDYIQRNALYYHNYVMQPWLEISLITGCCEQPVKKGFLFLSNKILSHHIGGEFANSSAKIDRIRENGGFVYAKNGGRFDVTKTAPTIVTYYTIVRDNPDPYLWSIQQQSKPSAWMEFLNARRVLWKP